jgi:hypothetical protein
MSSHSNAQKSIYVLHNLLTGATQYLASIFTYILREKFTVFMMAKKIEHHAIIERDLYIH